MRVLAVVFVACASVQTPAPARFACEPPPEVAGTGFLACEVLNERPDIPCCGYSVGDCVVVMCRLNGCSTQWVQVSQACNEMEPGEGPEHRWTCDPDSCA